MKDKRRLQIVSCAMAAFSTSILMAVAPAAFATQTAVVVTAASDFSSGAHAAIGPVESPVLMGDNLLPTGSDLTVVARGDFFYRIERFTGENVTKFSIASPGASVWQFSAIDPADAAGSSNPMDMIFAGDTKAYLLRYGKTKAWIVNPSAATEADFKTGEIDFSAYRDTDGVPEMCCGVVHRGKLFVVLQRLEDFCPSTTPYLAVFDVATDTEVLTGIVNDGSVGGIPLPVRNPQTIDVVDGKIYISGVGSYPGGFCPPDTEFTGGVAVVDPDTYRASLILDDGDSLNHPFGAVSGAAIVSRTIGFFIGYSGFADNAVYRFNPTLGLVEGQVAPELLANKSLTDMAVDENGRLWVSNATDSEVVVIDVQTGSVFSRIPTNLTPQHIAFSPETPVTESNLTPPVLTATVEGSMVTISWTVTENATAYRFYFAPYPIPSYVGSADLEGQAGPIQSITLNLEGSAIIGFYLGVQAFNVIGFSDLSNIVFFEML